jgi:glycosyltransferase involved in cell wall biosynthesis
MDIHQIVVSASAGDAVTNTALTFQGVLQRVGPSRLFARYIDERLHDSVLPLSAYDASTDPDDLLVYHVSIGEPEVLQFLLGCPQRLVIVYHNITPPEFFRELDPAFAGLLARGRAELEVLRDRAELALAVSAYNARELEAVGFADVRISPLPIDLGDLHTIEPDPATVEALARLEGPFVLYVGQLLPHKRPDLLLQAHHVLTTYLSPGAHLALCGPPRSPAYHRALHQFAGELNLPGVQFPGWVTDTQLAAFYARADVFATMSEHEGFCVPLLEAMSFDVPVVARSFGAIPDTMGDAGLLLPPDDDPLLIAEAVNELLTAEAFRSDLVERGRHRVAAFDVESANATFLSRLLEIVEGTSRGALR